jgi:hypothetical protein
VNAATRLLNDRPFKLGVLQFYDTAFTAPDLTKRSLSSADSVTRSPTRTAMLKRAAATARRRVGDVALNAPTNHDAFFRFHLSSPTEVGERRT